MALMETVTALGSITFTVTDLVVVPPGPVAVSVYVVETVGETDSESFNAVDTTPEEIETVVAFVVVHVRVDEPPMFIVVGLAVNVTVGGGSTVTVAFAVAVWESEPVAVIV